MFALWQSIKVFVKGFIMGMVNVFPISSGTVSLVLEVYERFINAINSLRIKNFKLLFHGEFKEFARRTDIGFLSTIVLGIIAGMVLTSLMLKQTLLSYKVYTWSFFIGLIIASVVYVAKRVDKVNAKNIALFVGGIVLSFLLSIKSNPYSNDSFLYLFLCGIIGGAGRLRVSPDAADGQLRVDCGQRHSRVDPRFHFCPWGQHPRTFRPGCLSQSDSVLPFAFVAYARVSRLDALRPCWIHAGQPARCVSLERACGDGFCLHVAIVEHRAADGCRDGGIGCLVGLPAGTGCQAYREETGRASAAS